MDQATGEERDVREGHHHLVARPVREVAHQTLEVRVVVVETTKLTEHLLISRQGPLDALGQERQIRLRHGGEASDALARDEKCTGSSGGA